MHDRLTLLLVDDDSTDLMTVRRILRQVDLDVEILEAGSLSAANDLLAGNKIDCLILDYRLAGEVGLELVQNIRQHEQTLSETGGLPIVILTGRGDEKIAVDAMKAGVTDYIPKAELTPDRISSAIRTSIEIHRQRGEAVKAQSELYRTLQDLERRVNERTRELELRNDELRQRNTELDEFAYLASHDLQEPLRKLIAFSELLPRDLTEEIAPGAKRDLDFIVNAAKRMQALVNDLLSLSRVGKAAMKHVKVPLQRCVDDALDALAKRIEDTAAQVTSDPLGDVMGDPMLLTQLYQNLIGNALKFVERDHAVKIHLTAEWQNNVCVFGVRDNGIGIDPHYAETIFAPFKRLHAANEFEGNGIGLTICRKTVERHCGRIWVESTPGKGSHFRFTIGQVPEPTHEQSENKVNPPVVLMVDDDMGEQELTRRALEQNGALVDLRVVSSGEAALDYFHRRGQFQLEHAPRPNLVLLDLNMPRVDGREVLRQIRMHPDLRRIPVVVFTTSQSESDVLGSYQLGCNSFVTKPATFDGFIETMDQLGSHWFRLVNLPAS